MKKWIIMSAMAFGFGLFATSGNASNCAVDDYDHNGSVMAVEQCDGELFISYSEPRAGIRKAGVTSGTLLFDGNVFRGGKVSGTAKVFSAKCGEISYPVTGTIRQTSISLSGKAPVLNSACRITRYQNDNLRFTLIATPSRPSPGAQDWYAIAGSFTSKRGAQALVNDLNGNHNDWFVLNTRDCPNFTYGYWIATIGPLSKAKATEWKNWSQIPDAYVKTCN